MIRVGIFGAENSHASAFCDLLMNPEIKKYYNDFTITVIGGDEEEPTRKLAEQWGLEVVSHTSEMIGKVDAAMITSRNGALHFKYAKPLIKAGIPLFIDKPISCNMKDCLALVQLAKQNKVPLVGGSMLKLVPDTLAAVSYISEHIDKVTSGYVYAPVSMTNAYGGFNFYAAHLVETMLAAFGMNPTSVAARRSLNGVSGIMKYADFDICFAFNDGVYQYGLTVITKDKDGGAKSFPIDIGNGSGGYALEMQRFIHMVRTGMMPLSYEELIQNVAVLDAIQRAYETNEDQPISGVGQAEKMRVRTYNNRQAMGLSAANDAAKAFADALKLQPTIHVIFAAAPSQNEFLAALKTHTEVDWTRVHAYHMDEYIGLPDGAPQSFVSFLDRAIFNDIPFGAVNRIIPGVDPKQEAARYSALLDEHPVDFVCLGIGENGHIAFNDPHAADFNDPKMVKIVSLDTACREQQVHDGCFPTLTEVPTHALTLTIPALMRAKKLFCIVPAATKAAAVQNTIHSNIGTQCPATVMRGHDGVTLYLDADSAGLV